MSNVRFGLAGHRWHDMPECSMVLCNQVSQESEQHDVVETRRMTHAQIISHVAHMHMCTTNTNRLPELAMPWPFPFWVSPPPPPRKKKKKSKKKIKKKKNQKKNWHTTFCTNCRYFLANCRYILTKCSVFLTKCSVLCFALIFSSFYWVGTFFHFFSFLHLFSFAFVFFFHFFLFFFFCICFPLLLFFFFGGGGGLVCFLCFLCVVCVFLCYHLLILILLALS